MLNFAMNSMRKSMRPVDLNAGVTWALEHGNCAVPANIRLIDTIRDSKGRPEMHVLDLKWGE